MGRYAHGPVHITRLLNWRKGKRGKLVEASVTIVLDRKDARCSYTVEQAFTKAAEDMGYTAVTS